VGKVCIFLCGENPDKNVDFCREGLTHVDTAVRAGRLKGAGKQERSPQAPCVALSGKARQRCLYSSEN